MNKYFIFLFVGLFLISLVSADLRVTLTTPQVSFDRNVSEVGIGDIVTYYVGVENKNSFPINIKIDGPTDLMIYFLEDTYFELQPGEVRDIPFSIKINTSGVYSREISVLFSGNGSSFSLSERLLFNIYEDETEAPIIKTKSGGGGSQSKDEPIIINVGDSVGVNTDVVYTGEVQPTEQPIIQEDKRGLDPAIRNLLLGVGLIIVLSVIAFILDKYFKKKVEKNKEEE